MRILIKKYKVCQRGDRGLVVTLPKAWADANDIKPGDVLDFFQENKEEITITKSK